MEAVVEKNALAPTLQSILILPEEVQRNIFALIPLPERLEVRLVCKKFRSIVESQLAMVRSLDVSGKAVKSMLDFVKDSRGREYTCHEEHHSIHVLDSLRKVMSFERVALMIQRYFPRLVYLRLHRLDLTCEGLRILTMSEAWQSSLEHFVIRSCYLVPAVINDDIWMNSLHPPRQLKHVCFMTITLNESLINTMNFLTQDLRQFRPGRNTIYAVM